MSHPETWQHGVFRPLLHHVPDDARKFDICGIAVRFSDCNCPTTPVAERAALDKTTVYCRECLAAQCGTP